ncbi:MAG: sensor histidine kinase [Microcoleus sp.]
MTFLVATIWILRSEILRSQQRFQEIKNVRQREARLEQESQLLESKVMERTQTLQTTNDALEQTLTALKESQIQLIQSEKMSALGQMMAGVAHEINNPVGFIAGNIAPARDYVRDLFGLINLYQQKFPQPGSEIEAKIQAIDLDYIRQDLPKLFQSMKDGVVRIKDISRSLRIFSRADCDRPTMFNIHEGIDSTILILQHRLKADNTRPAIEMIRDDTKRQFHRLFLTLKTSGRKNTVFWSQSLSVTGKISINVGTPDLLPGYVRPEARTQTQQC